MAINGATRPVGDAAYDRPVTPPLLLRPLSVDDERASLSAHRQMLDENFTFLLGYRDGMPWADYLLQLEQVRVGVVPEDRVPATFLAADVDGRVVGRTSIRHELNEFLAHEGGHIGLGIVAGERRQGYATEVLRQSVAIAGGLGLRRVLVVCNQDNIGSAATIERCGGVLHSVVDSSAGGLVRRYWIG
jgi:predicted acetyltransferase